MYCLKKDKNIISCYWISLHHRLFGYYRCKNWVWFQYQSCVFVLFLYEQEEKSSRVCREHQKVSVKQSVNRSQTDLTPFCPLSFLPHAFSLAISFSLIFFLLKEVGGGVEWSLCLSVSCPAVISHLKPDSGAGRIKINSLSLTVYLSVSLFFLTFK